MLTRVGGRFTAPNAAVIKAKEAAIPKLSAAPPSHFAAPLSDDVVIEASRLPVCNRLDQIAIYMYTPRQEILTICRDLARGTAK